MANFARCFKHVLGREGKFVNHKNDRGGATNWGITIGVYSKWLGRPASVAEVREMDVATAMKIYKKWYWDILALDNVASDIVAAAIFDQGVNRGVTTVAKAVQRIVGVTDDGQIGSKSLAAINAQDELALLKRIADNAQAAYRRIIAANPSQKVFEKGWNNRVKALRELAKWKTEVTA